LAYYFGEDTLRVLARYPSDAVAVDVPENTKVAYVKDHNLYIWQQGAGQPIQVTNDGHRKLTYGLAASRYEFGISKGTFWSEDGSKLAFYRVDHSRVSDYPIANYESTPARHTPANYPMNGDSSEYVQVGVYDLETGKTRYLETKGPYDQYLTNVTWSPGGNYIFIAIVNRDQNEMKLNQYDVRSGLFIKTLFTEKDDKYVEPEHGPIFFPHSDDQFLWFSERDGYNHLYWYRTTGQMLRQVTSGSYEVTRFLGFDKRERHIYYESTSASPLSRHVYRQPLDEDGEVERITNLIGVHSGTTSPDGDYVLIEKGSYQLPYMVTCFHKGRFRDSEFNFYRAPDPLEDYALGEIEIVELEAGENSTLYGRLIKPASFEAGKKYPVLVYVYGGPHVQMVNNKWLHGAQLFLQYMAQQGFVVFTLDNRGSAYRGLEFEQEVFRQLGTKELEDQQTGVQYLHSLDFVDTSKMAVYGWSYGGYMATSLMLRKPGLFDVAVAGGPVTDWRLYEVMYSERYMDRYEDNKEGFDNSNLANYAKNLEGRLLIIHGMQDSTVVPQHSMQLMRAFVENGKVADYFPYPSYAHNVRGAERAHLYTIIEDYIKRHLNIK
jgi:dipeptidyl-peptidase-4